MALKNAAVNASQEAAKSKKEEAREDPNDVSVGGSYGITKGSGWKMSLK